MYELLSYILKNPISILYVVCCRDSKLVKNKMFAVVFNNTPTPLEFVLIGGHISDQPYMKDKLHSVFTFYLMLL